MFINEISYCFIGYIFLNKETQRCIAEETVTPVIALMVMWWPFVNVSKINIYCIIMLDQKQDYYHAWSKARFETINNIYFIGCILSGINKAVWIYVLFFWITKQQSPIMVKEHSNYYNQLLSIVMWLLWTCLGQHCFDHAWSKARCETNNIYFIGSVVSGINKVAWIYV